MFAYRVAFDGRSYHGFQRQPEVPTVEGALLDALFHLEVTDQSGEIPPSYAAAGRTDAGVSAIGQTIAFEAPEWLTPHVFSNALPDEIHVWARAPVSPEFHARHDAVYRQYTYHLPTHGLDEALTRQALTVLDGFHDYRHLTNDTDRTRRVVHIDVTTDDRWLRIDMCAPGFSRQQVRRIVNVARAIGSGEVPFSRLGRLLSHEPIPDHLAIGPAPAEPLLLHHVRYDNIGFEHDLDAIEVVTDHFSTTARAAATHARMFEMAHMTFESPERYDRGDS